MNDVNAEPGAVQEQLEKWELSLDFEQPYRLEKMFPKLAGWGSKSEIKRKVALIGQIEPILGDLLLPNEEVMYVAKGVQHSALEALTIGALWSNMINQTVFVLTNLRLVMLRSNSKGRPRETCWSIFYSQISQFKAGFTGVLKLKLNDGRGLQFTGFSKLDKKSMPVIFQECMETYRDLDFDPECSQSREDLCGRCFAVVPKGQFECPNCETRFWTPAQVAVRSLIFPAWGDFLLKHRLFAVFEIIGIGFTWLIALNLASESDYVAAVLVVLFAHGLDAIVTYLIASKGLHPV